MGQLSARLVPLAVLAAGLSAQPQPARMGVTADRVLVNAVVMDRQERLITDLKPADFQLTVDRSPAEIDSFWREDTPVSAVIVFDASGSMGPVLNRAQEAMRGFFSLAHPGDEYALVLCKERPVLEVPFTTDVDAILSSGRLTAAKGSTPLYDAVEMALEQVKKGKQRRKIIFVISDGRDNASRFSGKDLKRRLVEADAYLYAVEFWTPEPAVDAPPPPSYLDEFAAATGGVYFGDVTLKAFIRLLSKLDIHQQYVMTFRPKERRGDGKYHPVSLRLAEGYRKEKLMLYWRHGYYDLDQLQVR